MSDADEGAGAPAHVPVETMAAEHVGDRSGERAAGAGPRRSRSRTRDRREERRGEREDRRVERDEGRSADAEVGEGFAARLIAQWVQLREERQEQLASPIPIASAQQRRAEVPWGVELAASWAWRFLVIAAAVAVLAWALGFLSVIVIPLVIALLITALVSPVVNLLHRRARIPRGLATGLTMLGTLAVVAGAIAFSARQVAAGARDMADKVVLAIDQVTAWLRTGPLHASDSQVDAWLDQASGWLTQFAQGSGNPLTRVVEVGSVAMNIFAGFFIVLFATYFFLAQGARIWSWVVRLSPRNAQEQVNSSGAIAWVSLTQFIRATVVVAAVDAAGIMIAAAVLEVPFVAAIGVLVFLGAFVPLVGATVTGTVAVLIALIDQGIVVALIMLGAVILVQQLESHLLQPFLMGKWVAVHPLGVLLAIATGIVVAGIPGALVAVPLAASLNAVALHLAAQSPPDDVLEAAEAAPMVDDRDPTVQEQPTHA